MSILPSSGPRSTTTRKVRWAWPCPPGLLEPTWDRAQAPLIQIGDGKVEHTPAGEPWRVPIGDDANQLTRLRVEAHESLGRNKSGERVSRYTLDLQVRNAADMARHRRVVSTRSTCASSACRLPGEPSSTVPNGWSSRQSSPEARRAPSESSWTSVDPHDRRESGAFSESSMGGLR